jgi:hypothetical protein
MADKFKGIHPEPSTFLTLSGGEHRYDQPEGNTGSPVILAQVDEVSGIEIYTMFDEPSVTDPSVFNISIVLLIDLRSEIR